MSTGAFAWILMVLVMASIGKNTLWKWLGYVFVTGISLSAGSWITYLFADFF